MGSVTPRPRFSPGERTPGTYCTGGWVGPRAGLDTEAKGKILSPLPWIESRSPGRAARSQTLYCLSYVFKTLFIVILIPSQKCRNWSGPFRLILYQEWILNRMDIPRKSCGLFESCLLSGSGRTHVAERCGKKKHVVKMFTCRLYSYY
jgi:hypothetical protein